MAGGDEQSEPVPSAAVRYVVVAATVAAVVALRFLFKTGADGYLVMGISITVAFQLLVASRPLPAVWGLWHLPIYYDEKGLAVIPSLLLVQICLGVLLSYWWRRSGNLTVTGTTHAFVDSVRNAIV